MNTHQTHTYTHIVATTALMTETTAEPAATILNTIRYTTTHTHNIHTNHTQRGDSEPTPLEIKCDLTTETTTVLGRSVSGERLRDGRCT